MSKQLFNGIAYIANFIATAAAHVASGYPDCGNAQQAFDATPTGTPTPEPEAPKKPGRPKKEVAAAPTPPAEPEKPATPEPEPEAEKPAGGGMTLEELQKVVEDLVKAQRGNEVRKEIEKFGVKRLSELVALPQHHAEFAKNIEALTI